MAQIILSEAAPADQGPITFGFGQYESFKAPFDTDDSELLSLAAEHPWLEVASEKAAPAAPASRPSFTINEGDSE